MSLFKIQSELKAPKNQFNKFGNYKYRSVEDILEALKPLLLKYKCALTFLDEIIQIGDRYYLKTTATLQGEDIQSSSTALAREPLSQKGMSEPQLTGSASSYARKYALNGLFAIDDSRDIDTQDTRKDNTKKPMTLNEYLKAKGVKDIKGFALKHKIKDKEGADKLLNDKAGLDILISDFLANPPARLP